jgi:molybdopterin-guanine dinucleotide biosynthesis protein A
MPAAGMLLTGGASRRMGTNKADLVLVPGTETLARRTARLLAATTDPAIEVGPGYTDLPSVTDDVAGAGPLHAIISGLRLLDDLTKNDLNRDYPVLIVATDLPFLTPNLLAWLAAQPGSSSVVPVAGGRAQTLCARYPRSDLHRVAELTREGKKSMRDLLAVIQPVLVGEDEWARVALDRRALFDIDTPEDLDVARRNMVRGSGR